MKNRVVSMILAVVMLMSFCCAAGAEDAVLRGYDKKAGGYQYVTFGSYAYEADGTEAPILWRVLSVNGTEAFLLTEYIVDFCYTHWESKKYYDFKDWIGSDLYVYLQETFTGRAFTAGEMNALIPDEQDGSVVAVLHVEDARNEAYGFADNNSRKCKGTPYAKNYTREVQDKNKVKHYTLYTYKDGNSPWFLREKSVDSHSMQREVLNEGKLGKVGCTNADVGIRPCINLDLNLVSVVAGSGTKEDPFVLMATAEADALPAGYRHVSTAEENIEETGNPYGIEPVVAEPGSVVFTAGADPAYIHEAFPALTAEGFLPEGEPEFVLEDPEGGLWLYCSQTLRIQITKCTGTSSKKKPLVWYEAHIFTRDNSELLDLFPYNEEKYTNIYELALPQDIAKQHKLVFGINSDYFIYRVTRDKEETYAYPIGPVIRDGKILYTQSRQTKTYVYPPLDVLALYPDGDMRVYPNTLLFDSKNATIEFEGKTYTFKTEKSVKLNARLQAEQATAEIFLASGATDTLCFGPVLISNGEKADTKAWGESANPRTGIGMVEKGHYIAIVVDGRKPGVSDGEDCVWLMDRFYDLGCKVAINLDGGATSAMLFMGKQISVAGNYANGLTKRGQNELLGIGVSDLVE